MKRVLFLIFLICFFTISAYAQILERIVTLQYSGITIEDLLNGITNIYKIEFSYSKDIVELNTKVDIDVKELPLSNALKSIFKNTGILYQVIGNQVVLKMGEAKSYTNSSITISGKVRDKNSGDALAFASVSLSGSNLGMVTNEEGEFIMKYAHMGEQDSLKVSFIGYKTKKISLNKPGQSLLDIAMEKDLVELEMVEVKQQTALSIIKEALTRIPANYLLTPYRQQMYLRDWTWMEGEPIQLTESIYNAYRGDVRQKEVKKQLQLIQGRKIRNDKKYAEVLRAFPALSSFDMGFSPYFVFNSDLSKFIKEDDFLGKNGLNLHHFSLGPRSIFDGRDVIVINYDQKEKNKSLYKGIIYLDAISLAFIKIIQYKSPKGIGRATIFGPNVLEKIFGLGENVLTNQSFTIQYKEINGKWFLNFLSGEQEAYLIKTKRKFNKVVQSKSDLVVTQVEPENSTPIADSAVANAHALTYRQYGDYDQEFWNEQNLIKPDQNFNLAFQRLSLKTGIKTKKEGEEAEVADLLKGAEKDNKSAELNYIELDMNKKTAHFNFLFSPYDSSIIDSIERKLEQNYERIKKDLKVKKLPVIEVKIYPSIETYHSSLNYPNAPDWMIGSAGINKIEIVSPQNPGPYHADDLNIMDGIVHEFTHCVHIHMMNNNFGSLKNNDVRWLWEALACYEAGQQVDPVSLGNSLSSETPTIEELNDIESGKIYELGYYIVDFIKSNWELKGLIRLIKSNGDLEKSLGISEKEFESAFYASLRMKYNQDNSFNNIETAVGK